MDNDAQIQQPLFHSLLEGILRLMMQRLRRPLRRDRRNRHLERLQAHYINVSALCHNSVRECQAVLSPLLFMHHEAVGPHVSYEEAIRVTVWRQEDVVAVSVHKRSEVMVEADIGFPLMKLADAEVLEPTFGTLHTV